MYKLYVFARSDLDSMTPGKLAAQVAHAASQAARDAYASGESSLAAVAYSEWEKSANGFGTTIVKDGESLGDIVYTEAVAGNLVPTALDYADPLMTGVVHDPSYPVRDGEHIHLIPLDTCYWAFEDTERNKAFADYVATFNLY